MNKDFSKIISFNNLKLMPSQIYGSIRLVPLVKDNYNTDLKMDYKKYDSFNIIKVDKNNAYMSYTPHAITVSLSGSETQNVKDKEDKVLSKGDLSITASDKIIKKINTNKIRFFPLHTAMENFLSMYFGCPEILWQEYSSKAKRFGLSPRVEFSTSGKNINGLEKALRIFEIHENQVGVLLFVSEKLASVFIVSNPDDYRLLHRSLISDFYGELIYYYGFVYGGVSNFKFELDESKVNTLDDLKNELQRAKNHLSKFYQLMSDGIINREIEVKDFYELGKYKMFRFLTDITKHTENHIGEIITDNSGDIQYMKTYLLSDSQIYRIKILKALHANNWHIEKTANYLNISYNAFILEIDKYGFNYILKTPLLEKIKKEERKRLSN